MSENKYLQWLTKETQSVFWHDSAVISELKDAIDNGARGVTTNPFLVASTLQTDAGFWTPYIQKVDRNLKGTEKVEALMEAVTGHIAEMMHGFKGSGFGYGYCCAQTDPNMPGVADKMIEQARRLSKWRDNIVVKIPATRAGVEAYEQCVAEGMNVAATVGFTVPQVLAVGEAYRRGAERARSNGITPGLGIAVLMVGRLDDYLRDVALDTNSDVSESDIIQSGTAAIKRAYRIFEQRGYECVLMPAGCRGAYHITELAGAKMIMSIAPKIQEMLMQEEGPFVEKINEEVDPKVIERLKKMPEFLKAYEPDGMTPDEFITFGSTNRTLTQFCALGWSPLVSYQF